MSFEEIVEELPKLTADEKERLRQLLILNSPGQKQRSKRLTKVFVLAKRDQACLGKSSTDDSETTTPVTNRLIRTREFEALAKCVKGLLYNTVRARLGTRPAPDRMNTESLRRWWKRLTDQSSRKALGKQQTAWSGG